MSNLQHEASAPIGTPGIASTVGLAVYRVDWTATPPAPVTVVAHATGSAAGIVEVASGLYAARFSAPAGINYYPVFDDGTDTYPGAIGPAELDQTAPIDVAKVQDANTAPTVGDALSGGFLGAFGRQSVDDVAGSYALQNLSGATVRTYTLGYDTAGNPSSRS